MPEAPPEDEVPKTGDGEEVQEAADELDSFEDMDFAIQMTKFDLARLRIAISFTEHVMPGYGIRSTADCGPGYNGSVPPSIELVRRRAIVAAYGLIEREFSSKGGNNEDD